MDKEAFLWCHKFVPGKIRTFFRENIHFSWKDTAKTVLFLVGAFLLCTILKELGNEDHYVSMIFLLAVFLISRFTEGFLYGTISSVIGVLGVNYVFTYPYFEFNFTLEGYPLTILTMFLVSLITCAMTTQIKWQEKIGLENEKERMRGNLLRAVSHDLRTPLTSILGATSTVIENADTLSQDEWQKLLKGVQEDTQWLIRMVENLLTVTRIDDNTGTPKITKTEEAAEEVITEAVGKYRKRFSYPPVEVFIPHNALFIEMDPMLIEQVLLNLMENAAIHAKTASWIHVYLEIEEDKAVFIIDDNGCGIQEDRMKVENLTSTSAHAEEKGGFGIGLSVCETIVAAHGGTFFIRQRKGRGTRVRFTLPLGGQNGE